MNISLTESGKEMSFKMFSKVFGKHFKTDPEIEKAYTRLTGKKVGNAKKNSIKNKSD